jgi:hypothetical protein
MAILFAVCTALATSVADAASMLDFDIWMRKIDKRVVDVQKKMALQDDASALAQATEIEELYNKMEDYFDAAGNADDAVKMSREGKEMGVLIAKSVQAKDYEAGSNAAVVIAKGCTNCHEVYRPFK